MDEMDEKSAPPPPSASAFLQKHTHHADNDADETVSSVSVGATEIVSNLIEGLVGGGSGAPSGGDDDVSVNSMKHRKESSRSYDQRMPKMGYNDGDGNISTAVPYRGFGSKAFVAPSASQNAPVKPAGPFAGLRYHFRGLFSPRATDVEQLLIKLQTQFETLEVDHRKYYLEKDGYTYDEEERRFVKDIFRRMSVEDLKDPKHPLNNPKLMTEVHFVGRKAIDPSVIQLTSLLANGDRFGCITELWLNDNLISDDGAAVIASFLQLPTCALVELWLGNNQIGPAGTTLLSAALSNNETTKLKCLGLYKNPIGNGGATTLAQMLRKNNTLSTVDVHGCGTRGRGPYVLESYGCKVVKVSDGTEYVARVVAPNTEEDEGIVTDQRLLNAIQTFVAFNKISPTREQTIRGIMSSNKQEVQDDAIKGENTKSSISKFLSELSNQPAHEKLTDAEKRTWKTCEWERLHIELQRARAAKSALATRLKGGTNDNEDKADKDDGFDDEEGNSLVKSDGMVEEGGEIGRDLDDEVVRTDTRSWRELKMDITGTASASSRQRKSPPTNGTGHDLYLISDEVEDVEMGVRPGSPPQSACKDGLATTAKMGKDREELEQALETVVSVEEGVKTLGKDDSDYAF